MARIDRDRDARLEILSEWDRWAATAENPLLMNGMMFFTYLEREKSEMLRRIKASGDRWQTVHGWSLNAGKVKE